MADVEKWFEDYRAKLRERNIHSGKYIHNFDETNARIGCPRGQEVVVPTYIHELYTLSPENRRSITVVESISADGREPPAPTIIVPVKRHIEDWYTDVMTGQEQVLLTDTRYINEEKAIE